MKIQGFKKLLAGVEQEIMTGKFRETFDTPSLDTGDPSRILNTYPVDKELALTILSELPEELFTPPLLDSEMIGDPDHQDYLVARAQYDHLTALLKPYLDAMVYKTSLAFLAPTRDELSASMKKALFTDYDAKIKSAEQKEQLIIGLYSGVFAIFGQALASAKNEKLGIPSDSYGPKIGLTETQIREAKHLSIIQHMIQEYQTGLSLDRIKNTKVDMAMLLDTNRDCLEKSKTEHAVAIGRDIIDCGIQRLQEIAVEDSLFVTPKSYQHLNTLLKNILKTKGNYENTPSDENFNRMMREIDQCIQSFNKACEAKPTVWEKKVKPIFKAILLSLTLVVASLLSFGYALAYLATHVKERHAIVDSFFKQDKTLKDRILEFKAEIQAIKETTKENAHQEPGVRTS